MNEVTVTINTDRAHICIDGSPQETFISFDKDPDGTLYYNNIAAAVLKAAKMNGGRVVVELKIK